MKLIREYPGLYTITDCTGETVYIQKRKSQWWEAWRDGVCIFGAGKKRDLLALLRDSEYFQVEKR